MYSLLSESAKNHALVRFSCSLIGQILIGSNLIGQIFDSFLKALCKEYTLSDRIHFHKLEAFTFVLELLQHLTKVYPMNVIYSLFYFNNHKYNFVWLTYLQKIN